MLKFAIFNLIWWKIPHGSTQKCQFKHLDENIYSLNQWKKKKGYKFILWAVEVAVRKNKAQDAFCFKTRHQINYIACVNLAVAADAKKYCIHGKLNRADCTKKLGLKMEQGNHLWNERRAVGSTHSQHFQICLKFCCEHICSCCGKRIQHHSKYMKHATPHQ